MLTVTVAGEPLTLYTLEEVADMLSVTDETALQYVRRAGMRRVLIGKRKMIPAGELRRFLTAGDRKPYTPRREAPQELEDIWTNEETLL